MLSWKGFPEMYPQAHPKVEACHIPRKTPQDEWFRIDEVITFSEADAVPNQTPHSDALIIPIIAASIESRKVYVDTRVATSVMYLSCFRKTGIDLSELRPCAPLQSYTQERFRSKESSNYP